MAHSYPIRMCAIGFAAGSPESLAAKACPSLGVMGPTGCRKLCFTSAVPTVLSPQVGFTGLLSKDVPCWSGGAFSRGFAFFG